MLELLHQQSHQRMERLEKYEKIRVLHRDVEYSQSEFKTEITCEQISNLNKYFLKN